MLMNVNMNDNELRKVVKIQDKINKKRVQIDNLQRKIITLAEDIANLRVYEKHLKKQRDRRQRR